MQKIFLIFAIATLAQCCKVGWLQLNDKCYMFTQHQHASWGEAQAMCFGFFSKLAEPRTQEESSFLISHAQKIEGYFWIGISDIIEENRWIYSSDQEPISISAFHKGQPNGGTSSNCVKLYRTFHGEWSDRPCNTTSNFVCEMPQNPSSGMASMPIVG